VNAQTDQQVSPATPKPRRRLTAPSNLLDWCLAALLGLAVLLVHDVPYLLHAPFWLDEAWVADSVRAPLHTVPSLASSTPLGWTLLLRLVPFGGQQRLRLVPLAFAGLAAVIGYLLGRELKLTRYGTGLLTGAAVLLSPAMLVRDDLKQYTAEACAGLLIWYLVARAENNLTVRRLIIVAAAACVALMFAATMLFVSFAAMAALAVECLIRREFRMLRNLVAVTCGMAVALAAEYELIMRPNLNGSLKQYWAGFYIPTSPVAAARFIHAKLHGLAPYMGFHSLVIAAVAALAGIIVLVWLRRYALAVLLPFTLIIVGAASSATAYPFGDERTSTFWLVLIPVLGAIAIAGAGHAISRIGIPKVAATTLAAALTAGALAGWVVATRPYLRSHSIPNEDVRSQIDYEVAHYRPGDVVVVSSSAKYGFYYYYPTAPDYYYKTPPVTAVAWLAGYHDKPWILQAPARTTAAVYAILAEAKSMIAKEPGRHGRIWIIRQHLTSTEIAAFSSALAGDQVTTIDTNPDPGLLWVPYPAKN
jgi:hypothetical protein